MKSIKKRSAPWTTHSGTAIQLVDGTMRVNVKYYASVNSVYGQDSPGIIKASICAMYLDSLLALGEVSVYKNDSNEVFMEFRDQTILVRSDGTVYHEGDEFTPRRALYADITRELFFGSNEELKDAFEKTALAYNSKSSSSDMKEISDNMLLFCDSYYYGCTLDDSSIVTEAASKEGMEAAFRSGKFYQPEEGPWIFPDNPKCKFDDGASEPEKSEPAPDPEAVNNDVLAACKAGEYRINFPWSDEQSPYIQKPELLDDFVPNDTFTALVKKIKFRMDRVLGRMKEAGEDWENDRPGMIGKDYINCTLVGKPGTGKTALAYALSAATGMPVYTNNCSHNTDEDEFEGKVKLVDGKAESVPTDGLTCFEHGGIYLLEEVNLPQAAVIMGALGQAVEFPFILKKNGYETIRRHPLCVFISTMNTGTAGSKQLSQPFANRFKQSYVLNDPDRDAFISILQTTGEKKKVCNWVYKVYETITDTIANDNAMADVESILLTLSLRSCMGAIENIQEGMRPKDAIRASIIGKIAETDMEVAKSCEAVLDAIPDLK